MSKIICEICGTKYPDTVEQCPICGYTNGVTAKTEVEEEILEEVVQQARPKTKGGRFSKSNVRKHIEEETEETEEQSDEELDEFNVDKLGFKTPSEEEHYSEEDEDEDEDDEEDDDDEDEDDEEDGGKSGTLLNILLGVVIVALLCVSGFIFVKYFLPNLMDKEPVAPTETYVETLAPETEAPETEAPTVPCTDLLLGETVIELDEVGQLYLLNVVVEPADTTDELVFTSSDESVVTVNEEGRVTAVGSGMAVVNISCGEYSVDCVISVDVPEETVPEDVTIATEEPTEPETEPGVQKTVTNAFVNIRSGAGTGYEKVGEYKKGDVVTIYEEKMVGGRPWGRTDDGWICTEYVK